MVETTKLPKARENACVQVVNGFSLPLIGRENGASFVDQSQSEVKQKHRNRGLSLTFSLQLLF